MTTNLNFDILRRRWKKVDCMCDCGVCTICNYDNIFKEEIERRKALENRLKRKECYCGVCTICKDT